MKRDVRLDRNREFVLLTKPKSVKEAIVGFGDVAKQLGSIIRLYVDRLPIRRLLRSIRRIRNGDIPSLREIDYKPPL